MEEKQIIELEVGTFEIVKNYRDAFDAEAFIARYVDVAFDRYTYIVGDLSSEKLRLKGFGSDPNSFKKIPDYLAESCNVNCAYFILRRIKKVVSNNKENQET